MKNRMKTMKQMAALLVLLGAAASHGRAEEFAPPKSYAVGTAPIGVVTGDFNGDGKVDLVVANNGSGNVSVLLGNGDGTFQSAVKFDAGIAAPESIFAGDFNGDGKLDVAVFQSGNSSALAAGVVSILFGNGDGSFQPPKTTMLAMSAAAIAVGDFNGDKNMDIVVANSDPATNAVGLQVLLAKGDGTFQSGNPVADNLQNANLAVADFNKDGKPDLAVAVSGGVQIMLGKGDGTFQIAATLTLEQGFNAVGMLTADLDSDGQTDLIVNSRELVPIPCINPFNHCEGSVWHFEVYLGKGDGTFQNGLVNATQGRIVGVSDFNGDGKIDAADTLEFAIRLGKGDGTLSPAIPLPNTTGWLALAADLDSDKLGDIIALDPTNNAINVFLNNSPPSVADLAIVNLVPDGAEVGQGLNLTYSAEVLNEGPKAATTVTFTDTLPSGVTFVSATSTTGSCTQSDPVVTCNVGSLASGAYAQINIIVTPTAVGTITNTMDVVSTETDLALANNSATQTETVVPVYTLTVNKTGNGSGSVTGAFSLNDGFKISCGAQCSATFLSGASFNLGETANSGSFFQGWGGACSGAAGCQVTMDSDKTVAASFVVGVNLTVNITGGGSGTVTSSDNTLSCTNAAGTCSSVYIPGSSISLTATPSGSSIFGSWSGACTGTDPNKCSIALKSDETVTATFNPPPDFFLSPAAKSLTAATGGQATDVISISEQGGFASAIQLTCSVTGPSPTPTCLLSPSNIPPGANSPSSTLTIAVPAKSAYPPTARVKWHSGTEYGFGLALALVLLITIQFSIREARPPRRNLLRMAKPLAFAAIWLSLGACGGGSSPPPPQAFTVTVTATSGTLQHVTSVSITVQ